MAFEIEPKRRLISKFDGHKEEPCVHFEEIGVTFNACFCETFGFLSKTGILVLYDQKAKLVGFRAAMNETEQNAAYKLGKLGKNGFLACSRFTHSRLDPKYLGKLYKATLSSVSRIVTVDLEKPIS